MQEIWKDIEGYEGLYQVSNLGRIKSLQKGIKKEKIRKQFYKKDSGYLLITLSKENKLHTYSVHRLVAKAFIPNPNNKEQVNHKNGIKDDNRVENLEWNTSSENIQHAYKTGLMDGAIERLKVRIKADEKLLKILKKYSIERRKKVVMFSLQGELLKKFNSLSEAACYFGNKNYRTSIGRCCNGKFKTYKGFKWKWGN